MIKKIRKKLVLRVAGCVVLFAFIVFLGTGCSEEQLFPGNARIKTAFRLTSPTALGGSIVIQEAYLKLERISVTGLEPGDKNAPEANYSIAPEEPPYRLSQGDTARVSLTLPTRAYDQMDLHLFLLQTDYELIVHQKTSEETPPPVEEPTGGVTNPNSGNENEDSTNGDNENDGEQNQDDDGGDEGEDGGDDSQDDDGDGNEDHGDNDDDDGHDGNNEGDDDGDKKNKKSDKNGDKDDDDDKKKEDDDDDDDEGDNDDDRDDDDGDDDRIGGKEVDGTVDLDHFFQHAKPSLVVFATWTFNGANINVVFAVTDVERITIRATQNDGPQIRVDEHGRGTVNFNAERWFGSISTTDLSNATLQTYQGQSVMFIHKAVNTALFETLLNNLMTSTTFEISASPVE